MSKNTSSGDLEGNAQDEQPEVWESIALSGILWALRAAGLTDQQIGKTDVRIQRITGTFDPVHRSGIAIAASLAVLQEFDVTSTNATDLQGWELK